MGRVFSPPRALACSMLAMLVACAGGCSSILGISEPVPRAQGGSSGASETGESGSSEAGEPGAWAMPGAGGAINAPCSVLGAARCDGLAPQVCTGDGWVANEAENQGRACSSLCIAGKCAECRSGDLRCDGNTVERCDDGAWVTRQKCAAYCAAGACVNPPSCQSPRTCGDGASCCRSIEVPGGSFIRDYDANEYLSTDYTATVSPFLLDRFEVTVARFSAFVNAYDQLVLEPGAGKSPHIPGDQGWQSNYPLPKSAAALEQDLDCTGATYTPKQNYNLDLPINCVTFYVAYAFCIWDGGRLPTEAEWNFAAAGGAEQREYPWSTPGNEGLDADHAVYGYSSGLPQKVGTKLLGNGRWGQSDLAGNVAEWTLDFYSAFYPSTVCNDCLDSTEQPTRSARGGGYQFNAATQKVSARRAFEPDAVHPYLGFRCARDLPTPSNQMVNQ